MEQPKRKVRPKFQVVKKGVKVESKPIEVSKPEVKPKAVVKPKPKPIQKPIPEPVVERTVEPIVEPVIEKVEPIVEPIIEQKKEPIMSEKTVENFEVPTDWSPLEDSVVERSYNETVVMNEIGDIPEPDFGSSIPDFDDVLEEEVETPKEPSQFDNITNPAMSELDDKTKKQASELLVDSVLEGYAMIHQLFEKVASIDEAKVYEKVMNGEIDSDLRVPIAEDGSDVNVIEYAQSHNAQVKEAFTYDPEFGEKVKPAMVRVFAKKGWGVTDEQYLLGMFGKDIAIKGVQIFSIKKQGNEMLKHFANATANNRSNVMQEAPTPVYTPDTITSQPKPEQEVVEMKVATAKMSVEEIEAQMMED